MWHRKLRMLVICSALGYVAIYYSLVNPAAWRSLSRRGVKVPVTTGANAASAAEVPNTSAGVPKLLHFIYKNKDALTAYKPVLETCLKKNGDWTAVLWTDKSIGEFIKGQYASRAAVFYAFKHKIQRTDAVRYLILHSFGGVYMDMDMVCKRPLSSALDNIECFLDKEREHQTRVLHNRQYSAMNSAMGCQPKHPFMRKVIDFVFHKDRLKGKFKFPYTIFDTTGPSMLTKQYQEWNASKPAKPVTLLNETYFSPMINPRSGVYGNCRRRMKSIRKATSLSLSDKACLEVDKLGYERSDKAFETNRTVAIHQFTHLGYYEQKSKTFDAFVAFPQLHNATFLTGYA